MAGPAAGANPIAAINDTPMGVRQWIVVFLMIFLNALDGFDVLSSAFAAPGITMEWGIPRSELGIVLSAELVGMGFGSVHPRRHGRQDTAARAPCWFASRSWPSGMWLAHAATGVDRADRLALHDRAGHRRHAGGDQRRHRRKLEQGEPQHRHGALRHRLSGRRRDRRVRRAGLAAGRSLFSASAALASASNSAAGARCSCSARW